MALKLTTHQEAEVAVEYKDKYGNPAVIDGNPIWAVSNADILRVISTNRPNVVIIQAVGPMGSSQVSVTADADLGEGVRELIALQEVSVVAGEAVAATMSFGAVRDKAEAVVEAPVEEIVEAPVEAVVEAPVEAPAEAPVEEVVEAPVEEQTETPPNT